MPQNPRPKIKPEVLTKEMAKEEVMGEVKGVGYDAKREELNDPRFPTSYPAEKGAQNTVKPQQTGPKLTPVPSNLPEDPLVSLFLSTHRWQVNGS